MAEQNIGGYYVPNYSNIVNTVSGIAEEDKARRAAEAKSQMEFDEKFREQSRGFDPVFMVMEENMKRQKDWEADFISNSALIHQDIAAGRKSREDGLMEVEQNLKDLNLRQAELLHYQKEFKAAYDEKEHKPGLYNPEYYDAAYESYRKTGRIPEGGMLKRMPLNVPAVLEKSGRAALSKIVDKVEHKSYNPKTGKVETRTVSSVGDEKAKLQEFDAIWGSNSNLKTQMVEEMSKLDKETQDGYYALGAKNIEMGEEFNDAPYQYFKATYFDDFLKDQETFKETVPTANERKEYGLGDEDDSEPVGLSGKVLNYEGEDIPFVELSHLPTKDLKVQPSLLTEVTDLKGNAVDFKDEAKPYNVIGATKFRGGEFLIISVGIPATEEETVVSDKDGSTKEIKAQKAHKETFLIPVSKNKSVADRFNIAWDEFEKPTNPPRVGEAEFDLDFMNNAYPQ